MVARSILKTSTE
uniref:Uncharacterized protein n=1 Tax=Rhizophora mucronata TaxID=61149 RepID=A0A2P2PG04_RHIMU